MEYVTGKRQVVLNFSEKFCRSEIEVLDSDCFKEIWTRYVKNLYETENQTYLKVLTIFPKSKVIEYTIKLFKLLLTFDLKEVENVNPFYAQAIAQKDV